MIATASEVRNELLRESRLRKLAHRQGYRLQKSRLCSQDLPEWGTYGLVEISTNGLAAYAPWSRGYGLNLDQIEAFLAER